MGRGRIITVTYTKRFLHDRGLYFRGKDFTSTFSQSRKGIPPTPAPYRLPVSLKGVRVRNRVKRCQGFKEIYWGCCIQEREKRSDEKKLERY